MPTAVYAVELIDWLFWFGLRCFVVALCSLALTFDCVCRWTDRFVSRTLIRFCQWCNRMHAMHNIYVLRTCTVHTVDRTLCVIKTSIYQISHEIVLCIVCRSLFRVDEDDDKWLDEGKWQPNRPKSHIGICRGWMTTLSFSLFLCVLWGEQSVRSFFSLHLK